MMILFLICVQVAYDKLATFVILICHGLHFLQLRINSVSTISAL